MGNCFKCILGQLFGEYGEGVDELEAPGVYCGFDVKPWQTRNELAEQYAELTDLWRLQATAGTINASYPLGTAKGE